MRRRGEVSSRLYGLLLLNLRVWGRGKYLTIQLLWGAAWLLVTFTCLVYLVDELVLVFLNWIKGNKLLGRVSFTILSSIHDRAPPRQCQRPQQVEYTSEDILPTPQIFGWIPNAPTIGGVVNAGCRWTRSVWSLEPQAGSWFRNFVCGYSTGSKWIEKDWVHVPPGLAWGRG